MSLLSSLSDLDSLRENASSVNNITRSGNLDIVAGDKHVPICHIVNFMPFSLVDENGNRTVYNELSTLESGVAVMLAAQHLNTGDGRVVPEVAGLSDRCPIRFTVEWMDTDFIEKTAVNSAIDLTNRRLPEREPCAITGALRSAVSIPSSLITGLRGYPQVSGVSTSASLDDKNLYPLFGRTVPSDAGTAVAAVLYMRNVLGIRYIAMVHTSDAYGTAYARGMNDAIAEHAPDMTIFSFILRFGANKEEVKNTVTQLKQTECMYFFGVLFDGDADAVLKEAVKQGIAGDGRHNWIFGDGVGSVDERTGIHRDSDLARAYQGTLVTKAAGSSDELAGAMREIGDSAEDLDYLKSVLPRYRGRSDGEARLIHSDLVDASSFLSAQKLWDGFMYDAAIAVGLSACAAARNNDADGTTYLDGTEHFSAMVNGVTFSGATGSVAFDPSTGSREAASASFEIVNFVENTDFDDGSGTMRFKAVQTHIFQNGEWTSLLPVTFYDGTSDIPPYLPEITVEDNLYAKSLQIVALVLCGLILILSIAFSTWTHVNRKKRVCKASQPLFLHIICAGTFILGISILPLCIDGEVTGTYGSDAACMAFPWLVCIGVSATFSAIYSKTHRINLVFNAKQFRRVTVKPIDVLVPMLVVLGANVVVLAVWTALAPLETKTGVVATDAFDRAIEVYHYCDSDGKLPYGISLFVINIGALLLASYEAYRAKDIPLEYAESSYIFKATACILLVCFMGIPVMVIAYDNPSAVLFVFTGIIFVTSCCVLLFIFVPKIRINRKGSSDQPPIISQADTGRGVKILSHQRSRTKLAEENERLKRYVQASIVHIKEEVKELEEVEIEENKPLREFIRTSLTKIKDDVEEIDMDGLVLSSLTTINEDEENS